MSQQCGEYDYDKDKRCTRVAKYICPVCESLYCQKHYNEFGQECNYCEPPMLRKIKKEK